MKDQKKLLLGTAMVALSAVSVAKDAEAVTQAVNINADIFAAIAVSEVQAMDFGVFTIGATAGTVALAGNGSLGAPTGTLAVAGGTPAAGIVGANAAQNGATLVFDTTATSVNIAEGGTATMAVNNFVCRQNGTADQAPPCTDVIATAAAPDASMAFGATLNVGGSQATGTYTGTFNVTVLYQ